MKEETLRKNNYLLCGGSFFSIKYSCLRVSGLYFFNLILTLAFSPFVGFDISGWSIHSWLSGIKIFDQIDFLVINNLGIYISIP